MRRLIDRSALPPAELLPLDGDEIAFEDRLEALARLRRGAGVVVVTGPEGSWFWGLASKEVKVRVEPDGYEFQWRTEDAKEWAYRAVGLGSPASSRLLKRKTPVPVGDRLHHYWTSAGRLLSSLDDLGEREPWIEEEWHVDAWDDQQFAKCLDESGFVALDTEWNIDTEAIAGASVATGRDTAYVSVWSADGHDVSMGERLRREFSDYLRRGGGVVLHGGRADIGTQYDGDPLELVDSGIDDTMVMAYLCPRSDMKVLMADLTWKPAGEVSVGDLLVGFDADRVGKAKRKMRVSEVQKVTKYTAPVYEITVADGRKVVCSGDHRWLVSRLGSNRLEWLSVTEMLSPNRRRGHYALRSIVRGTWNTGGYQWLSGILDGEGSISVSSGGVQLTIAQNPGAVWDAICESLREIGASWNKTLNRKQTWHAYTGSTASALELVGRLQPKRGQTVWKHFWEGKALPNSGASTSPIESIERTGEAEVVAIQTSTKTYVIEGFASHNCGEPELGLKTLARKYLGRDPVDFPGDVRKLPEALVRRYAGADARNTYDLFPVLGKILHERGQWRVYEDIEKPIIPIIASMEREGIPVDIPAVKKAYKEAVVIEQGVRRAIRDATGLDVDSDAGAREYVTRAIGYDPGTLDQRVLTLFPQGEIDLLLLHRRSRTRRRNFLKGILAKWVAQDKPAEFRIYPRFNQAGTVDQDARAAPRSGRLSSSNPNFQQQPRSLREIYVPPRGYAWWSFDYSGLELHIAAAVSGDRTMLRVLQEQCPDGKCEHFPKHGDLHDLLRHKVWEITGVKLDRAGVIKPFNFEQLYGGGAGKGVALVAKGRQYIDIETSQSIIDAHKSTFPDFWRWRERLVLVNRDRGYAETLRGRRRYIPEYRSRDTERLAWADRAGINHIIQGTGADLVKEAMHRVVPVLRTFGAHMCTQVHDEVNGWIREDGDIGEFMKAMEKVLTEIELPGGLKLKVEGGVGMNWGQAH